MELGVVGLGRMGANIARRLLRDGHRVVVMDRDPAPGQALKEVGADPAADLAQLVAGLTPPRHVWIMVPSGAPVTQTIDALVPLLAEGDCIIDGGNSNYRDSIARAEALKPKGLHFLDVGTSGGVWGLEKGFCLMIGGEPEIFERLQPIFKSLAPTNGYGYMGASGSGHFVKMVHNGIEYGLLQAYAEGFEMLEASPYDIDLHAVSTLWNQGGVVRSWLLELAERALADDPKLATIRGYVDDSGEGRWTVQEAVELGVPATVLAHSLFARFRSRQDESFGAKLIAALRQQFGGHAVKSDGPRDS
jgi:6-phosphogluconate dehydrogenase